MTEKTCKAPWAALTLSAEERAELASSLIDSLDATAEEGVEDAWEREIARRIADFDFGCAKTVPWDVARGRILAQLPHGK